MSRLYIKVISDRRVNDVGLGGDEYMNINIYYGSSKNSVLAGKLEINYPKDTDILKVKWVDAKSTEQST